MHWLLILTLKSILSSIIGSSFYQWFQGTTMGIWFQKKVDQYMEYFAVKYDLELAKKDAKFRKQYPLQADRLDHLEADLNTLVDLPLIRKAIISYVDKTKGKINIAPSGEMPIWVDDNSKK
jgi:hypothetical protein